MLITIIYLLKYFSLKYQATRYIIAVTTKVNSFATSPPYALINLPSGPVNQVLTIPLHHVITPKRKVIEAASSGYSSP